MNQNYEIGDLVKIKSNGVPTQHTGIVVDILAENKQEPLWSKYLVYVAGKIGEFHQRSIGFFSQK
tara:strand:+ start:227 stop:421 length:195 start_codon:yes stop_codon:yes gene_type:complete